MKLIDLFEAHHAYHDITWDSELEPIRKGDTLTVFHGFRDFKEAIDVAKHGTSGKVKVPRVYSYENDNNPHGLFVTLLMRVAEEFVGAHGEQAIMAFHAREEDLEAPVWPAGSYTVQGQMAQYFGRGAEGRRNRNAARKEREKEVSADSMAMQAVKDSDDPHTAYLLLQSREHQSLFMGDLSPSSIRYWLYRPHYRADWQRMSNEDFLAQHGDKSSKYSEKVFTPEERFDGDLLLDRLGERFGRENAENVIRGAAKKMATQRTNARKLFDDYLGQFIWPSQYLDCIKWLRGMANEKSD